MTLREVNRVGEGQKNVPKLRFKGYVDAWEQRKLGEVAPVRGGFAFKSELFRVEGVPIVRISNIMSNGTVGGDFVFYDEQTPEENILLQNGSIVIAMSGATTGKVAKLSLESDKKLYQNQRVGYFLPTNAVDYNFIFSLVNSNSFRTQLNEIIIAGAQPNISSKDIDTFTFSFPALVKEQGSIGLFLIEVDNLITLHQRKYDALKLMKKTLLSKMFPKNGEDVPEIRFKGFTDAWEQRKAKRLFVSRVDKGYPDLPVLSATQDKGMVRRDENGINIHYDEKNKSGYKRVMPGQFVIHLRSFQGGFAYSEVEGITSPAYTVFDFQELDKHIPEFWKYVFSSKAFIRRLEKVTYGIRDGRSIGFEDFLTLKFKVPDKREQKVIAEILARVNNLITLHQRKLDELKNMKKTLLQQMFV